jgi:site-specific recombinase XerD
MAEAGESLEVIQKILGHRSDEVTRSVYLHVTKKQLEIAPNRFERVMDN